MKYQGKAVNPAKSGYQSVEGSITLAASGIHFQSPAWDLTLPYTELSIDSYDSSRNTIQFHHPDLPGASILTSDPTILKQPGLTERSHLKKQLLNDPNLRSLIQPHLSRASRKNKMFWVSGISLLMGFLALLWFGILWLASAAVAQITPEIEQQIGNASLTSYLTSYKTITPPDINEFENIKSRLTESLVNSPYSYTLNFIEMEAPNAFAFPGGYIVMTSGLLELAGNDMNLIAGVMAHEIAHVELNHGLDKLGKEIGPKLAIFILLGNNNDLAGLLAKGTHHLTAMAYSRDMELEADAYAIPLLIQSEFDPIGLKAFLLKMKSISQAYASIPEFLSTHPAPDNRIRELDKLLN